MYRRITFVVTGSVLSAPPRSLALVVSVVSLDHWSSAPRMPQDISRVYGHASLANLLLSSLSPCLAFTSISRTGRLIAVKPSSKVSRDSATLSKALHECFHMIVSLYDIII